MKPSMKTTIALMSLALAATLTHADIITGTVTDADDGTPLSGAKVMLDASHFAISGADGKYSLNTSEVVTATQGSRYIGRMLWDGESRQFRWSSAYGEVSVEVRDIRGNLIDRKLVPASQNGGAFAFNRQASGIHIVSLKSQLGTSRFRTYKISDNPLTVREDISNEQVAGNLAKTAADYPLTFSLANYEGQNKTVAGSATGVNVALKPNANFTISNGLVEVTYTRSSGGITAKNLGANLQFLKSVQLSQTGGKSHYMENVTENNLTGGKAVEIVHDDGNKDRIILFPKSEFVYFKKWIGNKTGADRTLDKITQVNATATATVAAGSLKAAGTAVGLTGPAQSSYHFLAMADPATRAGLVGAWVTNGISSGIVTGGASGSDATFAGVSEFGQLTVKPGQVREGDMFALGFFQDARLGLEYNSNDIAKVYNIKMKPNKVVFCTWQSVGGDGSPAQMASTSTWLGANLVKYGYSVAQIDDGWQRGRRRFDGYGNAWPNGMKPTADKLKSDGLMAGIWFMPFAGTAGDAYFSDWYAKDKNGGVETSSWANTNLDVTLPAVKDYIKRVTDLIYKDWGYQYFKIDGMFTGLAAHQNYTNDVYKPDDFFFNARLSDKYQTNVEAYRNAWGIIRNSAPEAFMMGCTITQNMRTLQASFGVLDALRIGPDGQANWDEVVNKGLIRGARRYFYNGRVFWIDPDPVFAEHPFGQTTCSFNAFTGFMYTALHSKDLSGFGALSPAQLNIFKRTMPYHGAVNVRPADFFERNNPGVWLLSDNHSGVDRNVIGLFNWDQSAAWNPNYSMAKLGLNGSTQYVGFDFWGDKFVAPFSGTISQNIPATGNKIISVRAVSGNPMVLSTNRHIADPVYSVETEAWGGGVLSGSSKVVGGDDYELRIYAAKTGGGQWTAGTPTADGGATASVAQNGAEVRVTIKSSTSKSIKWSVPFN